MSFLHNRAAGALLIQSVALLFASASVTQAQLGLPPFDPSQAPTLPDPIEVEDLLSEKIVAAKEARVHEQLDKPTQLAFISTPLSDVADFLSGLHGIRIELDKRALEDSGIRADTPVTRNLRGISLRSALNLMLAELDLTFTVRDSSLVITTQEANVADEEINHRLLTTRVYSVQELLKPPVPLDKGAHGFTKDDLREVLIRTVDVDRWRWDDYGGLGSVEMLGDCMIVLQGDAGHRKLALFLSSLKAAKECIAASTLEPPRVMSFPVVDGLEQKIAQTLEQQVEFDFIEMPLQGVADFFADLMKINIVVDSRGLDDIGIGLDSPVTLKLKGVSLGAALNIILKQLDLTYVIRNEVLLITTPEACELELSTRVFPVYDLVMPQEDDEFLLLEGSAQANADYDTLIDLITMTVYPTTWGDVGGPGQIDAFDGCLVFSQADEVFAKVEFLLSGLRELHAALRNNRHRTAPIKLGESQNANTAKLRKALAGDVGMLAFQRTPLTEVVETLSAKHSVPILIDQLSLSDVGIANDTPIIVTLGGQSLAGALRRILRELDLTFTLRDEVIWITTPEEECERELQTWIYPVADLVYQKQNSLTSAAPTVDVDALIDVLMATVAPTTWQDVGGVGIAEPYAPALGLVVSQTEEVHQKIEKLFAQVRRLNAKTQTKTDVKNSDTKQPISAEGHSHNAAEAKPLTTASGQRLYLKVYHLGSTKREDAKELADVIRELIAPHDWEDKNYYLRPIPGAIIIRHKAATHRSIHHLLGELDVLRWSHEDRFKKPADDKWKGSVF